MFEMKGKADVHVIKKLLKEMIRIESINPAFPGGSAGEGKLGDLICGYFERWEIPYKKQEVFPGRDNIIASLKGKGRAVLCMEAHMDTVSVTNMKIPPFEGREEQDRIYGRGSCDDKASIACMMYALKMIKDSGYMPEADIVFVAAVDEEDHYRGVAKLLGENFQADGAIVGEPTSLHIGTACKGSLRFDITVKGKAGHSSRPKEGTNAISGMAKVILAVNEKILPLYEERKHPLLGVPTLNFGLIEGGTLINIIADRCTVRIDRRTLPGETYEKIAEELTAVCRSVEESEKNLKVEIGEPWTMDYAMETELDSVLVSISRKAVDKVTGNSIVEGESYCCDGSKFSRAGIPSIIFGPGDIANAHTDAEFVEIKDLTAAAEIYAQICCDFRK